MLPEMATANQFFNVSLTKKGRQGNKTNTKPCSICEI